MSIEVVRWGDGERKIEASALLSCQIKIAQTIHILHFTFHIHSAQTLPKLNLISFIFQFKATFFDTSMLLLLLLLLLILCVEIQFGEMLLEPESFNINISKVHVTIWLPNNTKTVV